WDTGSAALDLAERERLFRDLITIIDEEVLIIPMYQSVEFYGRRDGINWEPNVRFAIAPVTYYTNMSIISDALFAFWSEVGLNVDYQRVETEAWRNNLRGGGPGITIVSAGSTGDPGLRSDFRGWFEGNYADDQWTPTDEYTDLWDTGSAALDLAERERLFRDLITIID
ncbi:MAG: hypothetical protein AAFV33_29775, partial [Chloroflexota bacterium]